MSVDDGVKIPKEQIFGQPQGQDGVLEWTDPCIPDPSKPFVSQTDQLMRITGPQDFTLPNCPSSILSA